jgi:dihydrofolate synthase/folylpolyglutamate synthase
MKNTNVTKRPTAKDAVAAGKQRSYHEVVEFLDKHWSVKDHGLACAKQLDKALGNISQQTNAVLIAGTNGKTLTSHFAAQLFKEEGLSVGTFSSPHLLTYNERFVVNGEVISNKSFTDLGNEVINALESHDIAPNSYGILTVMALLHFQNNNVEVALLEVASNHSSDAVTVCTPKIAAITRIAEASDGSQNKTIDDILSIAKPETHVVSADQSKINLQYMQDIIEAKGAQWAMPIRKLAPLSYPFEQLHGRCAALAERIAYLFVNYIAHKDAVIVGNSLLTKQKGQRGRPTLEAKRQSELNPKRTLEQFWKEAQLTTLPARFQLLEKEKPTILLDNASNLDAFTNLLLGIRLLHYQRPLKGLTIILGSNNPGLDMPEFLKLLRYFFKKTSGQVIVCPVEKIPGLGGDASWDVEKVTNDIKSMKIKAKAAKNFKDAFESAQKSVDERHGLVVISGSSTLIAEYWQYKGIKKLS